jgi:hypothetical protein
MMPLPFLQLDFATVQPADVLPQVWSALSDPIVLLLLGMVGAFLFFLVVLYAVRSMYHRHGRASVAFDLKILLVKVPKELKKEDIGQEKSQQQIQEAIGHMETVCGTVGALSAERGMGAWFFGRKDALSFEIVLHKDRISFYLAVPSKLQSFMEEQVHAQYPNAEITEVPDYNIFSPNGVILGSYLTLRRPSYFPIKTYDKMETDSLNSLTNALAKIEAGDGAVIQYVVRSAKRSWRAEGLRIARAMQQGKKLKDVTQKSTLSAFGKELGKFTSSGKPSEKKPDEGYRLSPLEEEMVKGLEEKASKAGLDVNVRIVVCAKTPEKAQRYLNDILASYGQFNIYEYGNSWVKAMPRFQTAITRHFIYRHFDERYSVLLNAPELATVYHFPLPTTETPKINWLLSRKALPPSNLPPEGILLGISEYRGHKYEVRMKPQDRRRHMYVIGKSGSGKSVFQASLIKQDIEQGRGVCVIDPHGDLVDECLEYVPKERADDVIFFDPADLERPIGVNMLEFDPKRPQMRTFVINEMLKIFDKLYDLKATGGPMFETYMRNTILLMMDDVESGNTLMDVPRVLADEDFRNYKLSKCKSQQVKDFWQKEALKAGGESSLANMVPYITSKLASFIYNDYMRPIIGQQKSAFNVYEAMNSGKIILLKLSKGKIGDLNAYLLGMIMVGKILDAALARSEMDAKDRRDFYLYIDEFQNFLTDSINAILSEARKYGLNLIIAHQFIGQLVGSGGDTKIRDSIFGNVGTMVSFRVGVEDAEFLEKEFTPVFSMYDLVNVEAFTCNLKLLIDNTASRPFNMKPIMPPRPKSKELANMIHELSRYKYGRKRELVEAEMQERVNMVASGGAGESLDDFI